MIRELEITGYRCFSSFQLSGLARVNLLVGNNNSGKTSVLEAISFLASGGDPQVLWATLKRRGEYLLDEDDPRESRSTLDASHLFSGHSIRLGSDFEIRSNSLDRERRVACRVVERILDEANDPRQAQLFRPGSRGDNFGSACLSLHAPDDQVTLLPLTLRGGITQSAVLRWRNYHAQFIPEMPPVRLITTESLGFDDIVHLWEKIALTAEEDRVTDALKIIEPDIERIAIVGGHRSTSSRGKGGVMIKLKGTNQPVPIGSLGDGMWRMLATAIALIRSENGVFLIDEIDTGLHYTVMEDMWKMIGGIAAQLNVQVFATTHSSDCVNSLAAISQKDSDVNTEASLQRIERNNDHAIAFSEREIAIAARRGVEVR